MSQAEVGVDCLGPGAPMVDTETFGNITLRPHQLALLHRCIELERGRIVRDNGDLVESRIGILGDCTGSGKSFVTLALVATTCNRNDDLLTTNESSNTNMSTSATNTTSTIRTNSRAFCGGRVVVTRPSMAVKPCKCSLLVVPHALVSQWSSYIAAFCRGMKTLFVTRQSHVDAFDVDSIDRYDLVVTIGTTYNALAALLCGARISLHRVVYDEADTLAQQVCLPVEAHMTWFVTASYANLIYPRGHVHIDPVSNLISSTVPGLRGNGCIKALFCDLTSTSAGTDAARSIVVRCDDEFVHRSLGLQIPEVRTIVCRTPRAIRVLSGSVDSRVIDCLNAGDVSGALIASGGIVHDSDESVVSSLIARMRNAAHGVQCRIDVLRIAKNLDDSIAGRTQLEREEDRLCGKLSELTRNIESIVTRVAETDTCCICCDGIKNKSVTPCCTNSFCFACVTRWLQLRGTCPLCKSGMDPGQLHVVTSPRSSLSRDDLNDSRADDKLSGLLKILKRSSSSEPRGRSLVFSAYDRTFDELEPAVRDLGLRCRALKGNHQTVKAVVDDYRAGSVDVLLVNAKNYGSGLNLECTTDVVLFHRLDNEIERQVVGRALRVGRTEPLKVWYLLYENEIPR